MRAFPLQVLITVVDRGKGDKMARLYERAGVKTQLICLGFGTAKSELLEYLGLGDLEKDILFSAAPRAAIRSGLEKLRGELPFLRPGGGVACSVTLSSVSMAALRQISIDATIIETGEVEKMEQKRTHEMIVCVADRGQAELVMDAARQAGASGGTVVHARGFNQKEEENFLHLLIRPEKELVLVIVPVEQRRLVMQALCDNLEKKTGDPGVVFSLPVEDVMGLHHSTEPNRSIE